MALNGLSEEAQKNFDKYLGEGVFEEMLRLCHNFNEDITLSASEVEGVLYTSVDANGTPVIVKFFPGDVDDFDDCVVVNDGKKVDYQFRDDNKKYYAKHVDIDEYSKEEYNAAFPQKNK